MDRIAHLRRRTLALSAAILAGLATAPAAAQEAGPQLGDLRRFQLLDNGRFTEPLSEANDGRRDRIPWWRNASTRHAVEVDPERGELTLQPGARIAQPVAAYAPATRGIVVRGRVSGDGRVALVDALGGRAEVAVGGASDGWESFAIDGETWAALLGRAPLPRLELELAAGDSTAVFADVAFDVPLPCPSEAELRAEILARLAEIFELWLERGLDRGLGQQGPRSTGFVAHLFDARTGAALRTTEGGLFPLYTALLDAAPYGADPGADPGGDPAWQPALATFLEDYLSLGFHPDTGLPRKWDTVRDVPLDDGWIEIASDLEFLLDVAERGPEPFRARADAAARRIGATVLEHGLLPDGSVASKYRARDAATTTNVVQLRRLDVPKQLARLAARTGDTRYASAARNALAEVEFTHYWTGEWDAIDPGFDDDFGHYGERSVAMAGHLPGDVAFGGLAESGWRTYAPLWRDALRFGGSIAADQVRCWDLLVAFAPENEGLRNALPPLLLAAARAHFKGEQYRNGAWGDITFVNFDPRSGLEVGDLGGTPANLLYGLAVIYDESLGLRTPAVRAMFTTVLRSTVEHYRRPYGYLLTADELPDQNMAGGGVRMLNALLIMLGHL
ncbi:MAG: hypothetical protein E2O39_05200 [Planctomycetota bacterium]|nr:MAG: hypothetical protein E2O39_05200 [Planctomycetota bacterium]